jgi:hypothetical protein
MSSIIGPESGIGDTFERIKAVKRPEVPQGGDSTRVQIRLPGEFRFLASRCVAL